jgi:hypothetical protein
MIRLVTDFVEKPSVLILCDQPSCGNYASQPFEGDANGALHAFLAARGLEGWVVAIHQHICPSHVQQAKAKHQMIHVPEMALRN